MGSILQGWVRGSPHCPQLKSVPCVVSFVQVQHSGVRRAMSDAQIQDQIAKHKNRMKLGPRVSVLQLAAKRAAAQQAAVFAEMLITERNSEVWWRSAGLIPPPHPDPTFRLHGNPLPAHTVSPLPSHWLCCLWSVSHCDGLNPALIRICSRCNSQGREPTSVGIVPVPHLSEASIQWRFPPLLQCRWCVNLQAGALSSP